MVSLAHKFAFEQPERIDVEAISAPVLLDRAQAYQIRGTPVIVVNGAHQLRGQLTPAKLLAFILSLSAE